MQSIRVLVVDDSGFMRRGISRMLQEDADISVVGEAADGDQAIAEVRRLHPDVVTMDVEMPGIGGIESVKRIMSENPLPILMFSSLTRAGATATMDSLAAGATDFLAKESSGDISGAAVLLRAKVRMLARSKVFRRPPASTTSLHASAAVKRVSSSSAVTAGVPYPVRTQAQTSSHLSVRHTTPSLVLIGASTGGPKVLQEMLVQLPARLPYPIVVVQHMPAQFTLAFAERLDQLTPSVVQEAAEGDMARPGHIYIAPGGQQIAIQRRAGQYMIHIAKPSPGDIYKPCIDKCFGSLADSSCNELLVIVLTGMGSDGAAGTKSLSDKGAVVWTQDSASCVVAGMPNAVQSKGVGAHSLTPDAIVGNLIPGSDKMAERT